MVMALNGIENDSGEHAYEEREAVAVFDDEKSLNAAVDELFQVGVRQEDLSLLADSARVQSGSVTTEELEDKDNVERKAFVSSDTRVEGLAALVGVPAYVAGAGAAAIVATGGAALIPTIAVVAGSGLTGGALGLVFARAFGRRHAERIQQQIADGGLILWVHAADPTNDAKIIEILKRHSARDVHVHVVKRSWGVADVPLHDFNPDPLLRS
jgi:hypothetical protein